MNCHDVQDICEVSVCLNYCDFRYDLDTLMSVMTAKSMRTMMTVTCVTCEQQTELTQMQTNR
jgi:hypothetical protein